MSIIDRPPFEPGPGDGLPGHYTLPGSGFSVPAGLEAVIEYRGLLMNVQPNVDKYRITTIDGLQDADVRDVRDVNSDADGEAPYISLYGGRTIVINGSIWTYSVGKMRDMQMALRAAFTDLHNEYPLVFHLGDPSKDHFINCKKISSIMGTEAQPDLMAHRDFQISLRASNPRFLSFQLNSIDEDLSSVPIVTTPVPLGTAHNRGNYNAQPIYRVYGRCSRCMIQNAATGKKFNITLIEDGDYIELDLTGVSPTCKDSTGDISWSCLTDDSDFVELAGGPGGADNQLYYSGDPQRITVTWRDSWI